jgi:hypothetical protein
MTFGYNSPLSGKRPIIWRPGTAAGRMALEERRRFRSSFRQANEAEAGPCRTPRTRPPKRERKRNLRERAVGELEKYATITVYLWLLFALFSLHTRQVLQQHGMISVWQHGFALVNALIFGKIILIAQALEVGKSLERRALLWIVLGKSLIFAILLIAFHIVEGAIRAWFESQPISAGLADFGGTLPGLLTYAAIFCVVLIPFFAFQETARILGSSALRDLFVRSGEKRFRLIEG